MHSEQTHRVSQSVCSALLFQRAAVSRLLLHSLTGLYNIVTDTHTHTHRIPYAAYWVKHDISATWSEVSIYWLVNWDGSCNEVLDWRVAFRSRVVHLGTFFHPQTWWGGEAPLLYVLYVRSAASSRLCGAIWPGYKGVGSPGGTRSISSSTALYGVAGSNFMTTSQSPISYFVQSYLGDVTSGCMSPSVQRLWICTPVTFGFKLEGM